MKRRSRVWFSRATALSFCVLLGACEKNAPPSEIAQSEESGTPSGQARWAFHPLEKAQTADEIEYRGGRIEIDRSGSRWLILPDRAPEVSPFGAPEALTAVVRSEGRFAFVGDSGTVYFAKQPLSPLEEALTPPERFVVTRRAGDALVALGKGGGVFRSTDLGRRWQQVGPTDQHFADLAVAGDGTVLAYSVPERWVRSVDGGKTFSPLNVKPQAPSRLDRLESGEIYVLGLYGASIYRRGRFEPAEPQVRRALTELEREDEYRLPKFARASTVARERAVLVHDRYLALTPSIPGTPWKVLSGDLESPLESHAVNGLKACGSFRVTAAGERSAVACVQGNSGEVSPVVQLYRAGRVGADYKLVKAVFRGAMNEVSLAMSAEGQLAATGLCSLPEKGCSPLGVTVVETSGEVSRVHLPGVPVPGQLTYDASGRLWLFGAREKDGHQILFGPVGPDARVLDLTAEAHFDVSNKTKSVARLLPGPQGLLAVSLSTKTRSQVALVDEDGRLLSTARVPAGVGAVHGAGRFLAALDSTEGTLWSSTTGGLAWSKNPLPRNACSGPLSECRPALVCSESGCLVGDELSRLGWGASEEGGRLELPYVGGQEEQLEAGIGFECSVDSSDWMSLSGLRAIPTASDASLGRAAWTGAIVDDQRAALTAVRVEWGKKELLREPLLAPGRAGEHFLFVAPQVEGIAAIRYAKPRASRASKLIGAPAPNIEIAWDNRISGTFGSAEIDHPSLSAFDGVRSRSLRMGAGKPSMLSVAGRGVYLKLSSITGGQLPTFFIQGRGQRAQVETLDAVGWPEQSALLLSHSGHSSLGRSVNFERARIEGQHAALAQFSRNSIVALAHGVLPDGSAASTTPYLMGLLSGDALGIAQRVRISYLKERVGYVSMQVDLDGPDHRASFVELSVDDGFKAPVAVPLQHDLKGRVLPCSAHERESTPRVVAPALNKFERRVVVSGLDSGLLELVTDDAVLYGTPAQPCVAAFDAQEPGSELPVERRYYALVFPDETESSWLFSVERPPQGDALVSVRPMDCRGEVSVTD